VPPAEGDATGTGDATDDMAHGDNLALGATIVEVSSEFSASWVGRPTPSTTT